MTLRERRQNIVATELHARETFSGDMPKSEQIGLIDKYWAIDANFANSALLKLSSMTIAECDALQTKFEAKEAEEDAKQSKPYAVSGSTAIIPISGPMTKKPSSASFLVGGTSTRRTIGLLNLAESDPDVTNAILFVDSPGGQVEGTAELGDTVREFKKPIVAYIEDKGMSAAYWPASQCNAIYCNRTACVASIGVRSGTQDSSQAAAMRGIIVYPIVSGELKAAGEPGTKITEKQLEYFTGIVKGLFAEFQSAVQTGRGMTDEQFAKVSDGRVILAREALELGLVDGICSFEECLSKVSGMSGDRQQAQANNQPSASSSAKEPKMSVLSDLIARIQGKDPEAAAALSNLKPEDFGVPAQSAADARIAALEAENARTRAAMLEGEAEAFWNSLMEPDADGASRAVWTQREGVIATFKALALMDGGGQIALGVDNKLQVGANLKAYKEAMSNAAPNYLQAVQMVGATPQAKGDIREDFVLRALSRRMGREQAEAMMKEIKDVN